ncbi:MAG: hypothetical protein AAF211_33175, partial [Myxococcota bacterium]
MLDADEICDGEALADQSCASVAGVAGGRLGCAPDCDAFDISGCCALETVELPVRPSVDIVVVVDNSASMGAEVAGLEASLDLHLAQVLSVLEADYRIVVVSAFGSTTPSGEPLCFRAPLSGNQDCFDTEGEPPANLPPTFYHYSVQIGSTDALCKVL